jgi:hypothetical protein
MIDSLRRLNPLMHNILAVWTCFKEAFQRRFTYSTKELQARAALKKHKFRYPNIDRYIATFEDLVVKAGYDLRSQETFSLFLKGFSANARLLDKLFLPPVPEMYLAIKRQAVAITKLMQLVNAIAQAPPSSFPF